MAYTFTRRSIPIVCTTLVLTALVGCGSNTRDTDSPQNGADSAGMAMRPDSAGAMSGSGSAAGAATMANSALDDTAVVHLIAAVDRGEAAAGRVASTKATAADVKAYARMMVQEHTADLTKLRRLAAAANITLDTSSTRGAAGDVNAGARGSSAEGAAGGSSSGMTNSSGTGTAQGTSTSGANNGAVMQLQQNMQQAMGQLQSATGAEFDRQYIASQLAGHQQVLDLLRQNESRLQNSEVRSHVTAVTAAVEKHLERARQIQQKLSGDSTAAPTAR